MIEHLKNLYHARELLQAWTWRIVRVRYQQSLLGGLWAIVQPLATVAIFSIVFTRFVRIDTGGVPYVLFSFATVAPWSLFSGAFSDCVVSLVQNMNLVTKIYFPREVLPIAAMLARLVDFGIAFALLVILMLYFQAPFAGAIWLYLPVLIVIQLALALGLGLIGAALNVFYRDVSHIIPLGLQIWMYASPIIYPVSMVPADWRPFYYLNPMVGVVESYRAILLYGSAPNPDLVYSAAVAISMLVLGYWFFKRVELQFADVV